MLIDKVHITKFRAIQDQEFEMGKWLTGIFGRNKTQKSTLLGIISQGFTIPDDHVFAKEKTLDGYNFKSQMSEKFKFDVKYEEIGSHQWTLYLNKSVTDHIPEYPIKSYDRYQDKNPIRFWYAKDKNSKINYVERPVYYLSLKRLNPIGESELNKKSPTTKLTENGLINDFSSAYADILTDLSSLSAVPVIAKSGKEIFEGINANNYSYLTNSAGQSNVSRIILAVLSFQNLKEKYPNEYKGGILLIDELDATLHPLAQRKMLGFLHKKAKELDLQIVFTSHSKVILDELKKISLPDFSGKNNKVLFLENGTNGITIKDIHSLRGYKEVEADLEVVAYKPEKVKVYCEDTTATTLASIILPREIRNRVSFQTISIGLPQYITLYQKKFYDLQRGIIVMDGDWKTVLSDAQQYVAKKAKTIVALPKEECFEVAVYKLIKNMTTQDFENQFGIKQDVVLRDYLPAEFEIRKKPNEQKDFAKLFFKQTPIKNKLFTYWKSLHLDECREFTKSFIEAFNFLAKKLEIDPIE